MDSSRASPFLLVLLLCATFLTGYGLNPFLPILLGGWAAGWYLPGSLRSVVLQTLALSLIVWLLGGVFPLRSGLYNERNLYVVVLGSLSQPSPLVLGLLSLALTGVAALARWVRSSQAHRQGLVFGGLAALILFQSTYWAYGLGEATYRSFRQEPARQSYAHDGGMMLKTVHLMRRGMDFYSAHAQAYYEDRRWKADSTFAGFSLRSPLFFGLWKALPGPETIVLTNWAMGLALVLWSGWHFWTQGQPLVGLCCMALLLDSFLFQFLSLWSTYTENLCGLLLVLAYWGRLYQRTALSLLAAGLALLIRELAAPYLGVEILLALWARQWRKAALWIAALGLGLSYHHWVYSVAAPIFGISLGGTIGNRVHPSLLFTWQVIRFGTPLVLARDFLLPLIWGMALVHGVIRRHPEATHASLLLASYLFLFTVLNGPEAQYYSFCLMPLGLTIFCRIFVQESRT